MRKERVNEIWGILFLLLGLFTLASLVFFYKEDLSFYTSHPASPVRNVTGLTGAYLAFGLILSFGVSSLLIPGLFLLWAGCFFLQRVPERKFFKFAGLCIALFATSTLVAIYAEADQRLEQAGAVGYVAGTHLLRYFGSLGSTILAGSCLMLSLILATDFLLYPLFQRILTRFIKIFQACARFVVAVVAAILSIRKLFGFGKNENEEKETKREREAAPVLTKTQKGAAIFDPKLFKASPKNEIEKEETKNVFPDTPLKVKQYRPDLPEVQDADKKSKKSDEPDAAAVEALKKMAAESMAEVARTKPSKPGDSVPAAAGDAAKPKATGEENASKHAEGVVGSVETVGYKFPPLDLLKKPQKSVASNDNLQGNSKILEDTLAEFGIEVKVMEVEQGPVITRYELMPAPGVKVNSIAALSDDIALALKAPSVRLIIPIPGKSAVGVEVPNSVASMVSVRELIESSAFQKKQALPLVLGKDTSGKTLIADLAGMPHLLIAGTTGSGKTVCVNSIIIGLMYACSPADLKFVMVDPKMVELAVYNKLPHMLAPVVTDVRKASMTLNWVVSEMENRYKLLAKVGLRNIQGFNSRVISEEDQRQIEEAQAAGSENVIPAKLPYIVVVIDELADLMMVAQDKVEGAIARLAQLSRAVGIHLILATQRPSVDVITGVIKANFPARISFKVASKVDSRTVIDASGADKLIGKGDMLFIQPGDSKPIRGQASLIVDEEINAVVKFVSEQAKPHYHKEIMATQENKQGNGAGEKDEFFDEAVAVVLETGQASTSNLQRRLRLGYTRAARIIDQMEAEGLVGPANGAKPREIFMARDRENVGHPTFQ